MKRPAGQTLGVSRVGDGAGDPAIRSTSDSRPEGSAPGRDPRPTYRKAPWDRRHLALVWGTLTDAERRCLRTMGNLGGPAAAQSLVTMGLLTEDGARTAKGQAVLKEAGA